MKFKLQDEKTLLCCTEGQADRKELITYLRLHEDWAVAASLLMGPDFERPLPLYSKEYRWYECTAQVGQLFVMPFVNRVRRFSGNQEWMPTSSVIDLMPAWLAGSCHQPLCATHTVDHASLWPELVIHTAGFHADKSPEEAVKHYQYYCEADFGVSWHQAEYIENGNGTYSHNPRYPGGWATVLPYDQWIKERGMTSYGADIERHWLLALLFERWTAESASPTQKAIMAAYERLHRESKLEVKPWREYNGLYCWPEPDLVQYGELINWSHQSRCLYVQLDRFRQLIA